MTFTPPPPKPAPTLGAVQQNFRYRLRNFTVNDQFTIVEDLPRAKPIRQAFNAVNNPKPGQKTTYQVYLIRISSNGFEADLELFDTELNNLAIACPKDTQNFKGITLAFDGRKWVYIGAEMPYVGNMPQSDPRQPDLNPPPDQRDVFLTKLTTGMQTLEALGNKIDASVVMKICDNIMPGKGIDLFSYAKGKGAIIEKDGVYRVVE